MKVRKPKYLGLEEHKMLFRDLEETIVNHSKFKMKNNIKYYFCQSMPISISTN